MDDPRTKPLAPVQWSDVESPEKRRRPRQKSRPQLAVKKNRSLR